MFYKTSYSVTYNGKFIGYSENKSGLQQRLNEYMQKGEGENVGFVQIDEMPEYELCLLKRDEETNDEQIYNEVTKTGVTYYQYYVILDGTEEKVYLPTFQEAETVVAELKKKKSNNIKNISILEKYTTEEKEFTSVEDSVTALYQKAPVKTYVYASSTINSSSQVVDIGMSLINPVSGTISSRFGRRGARNHSGLDIYAQLGTPIYAAASGTVILSANVGNGYGNYIIVSHGNGVQTYYAHCTKLYVAEGASVTQGQLIATVGSTGNSTGPHLHFEVRVNGVAQNPENYVY